MVDDAKNPLRTAVARDIVDAILKMTADKHNTAVYWNQSEQEQRLEVAYQKWADHGGVWTVAATKVHLDQLSHVRKGCLTCPRQDIRADGSHIEGSHKGWNSLQRSQASGIVVFSELCHDFVLRRNIQVSFKSASSSPFLRATLGSHHIHLVNSIATFWNSLLTENKQASGTASNLRRIPELQIVASGETFGLVNTKSAANYHNLLELKNEPEEELYDLSAQAELNVEEMLQQIDVNPELLRQALASGSKTHLTATATGSKSQLSTWSDTSDLKQSDVACVRGATTYSLASMSDPSTSTAVVLATPISCTPPSDVIDVDSELHVRKQKAKRLTFNVESEEGSPSVPKNAPVPMVGSSSQAGKRKVVVDGPNEDKRAQSYSGRSLQDAHALEYISAGSKRVKLSVEGWKSASLAVHNPRVESGKTASPSGGGTSTSTNGVSAGIADFFSSTRRMTAGAASSKNPGETTAAAPCTRLEFALPLLNISGLTASQRLFSISTGVHALSLTISTDNEFYLFMDLRSEQRWVSYDMTPWKWVTAANDYNLRLEALNWSKAKSTIRKTPRALMEKLGEIEPKLLAHLASGKFTSKHTNNESFWKRHCNAVPMILRDENGKTKKACTRKL
ncbi:hypothetical protein SCP_0505840 [Sparassis crispa]|uniref:Uncharacterized protein n=1 Tax=Sparassis crispa TaxID=139825 RepID=A0A401GMX2_9APHY|nr:hypothetical protein SCP_0505840 [Sparassis crispa]GBE83530.1 hypothetical protein SCP_0505840 [Sparassis crispa]